MRGTGGGPSQSPPSENALKMDELFGKTASFSGIDGGLTTPINYGDEVNLK